MVSDNNSWVTDRPLLITSEGSLLFLEWLIRFGSVGKSVGFIVLGGVSGSEVGGSSPSEGTFHSMKLMKENTGTPTPSLIRLRY